MLLEESTTYQALIEKGMIKGMIKGRLGELHSTLLRLGTKRFGQPSEDVAAMIGQATDPVRLERMRDSLLDVGTWADLLAIE